MLSYLKIEDRVEQIIAEAVIEESEELRRERYKAQLSDLEVVIHNGIASAFKAK